MDGPSGQQDFTAGEQSIAMGIASHQCKHGFWEGACNECKPIHSAKDQQWSNFTYPFSQKDQVPISSKQQFLRECRKRGMVWTGYDDLVSRGVPYHPNQKPLDTSRFKPMMEEVYKESRDSARVERKWQQLKAAGKLKEG